MTIRTAVLGRSLSIAFVLGAAAFRAGPAAAQMAAGKDKFVGNVTGNSVPSNFNTYWNQITPENATKWGSVEGTRNSMNWAGADAAYNHAQTNGYKFKFHTFVWGSQYPGWLTGLSQTEQRAEIEQWIQAACTRYPNTWAIDVVNEPIKTAMPFKAALGGDGATGWDWVITSFQLARQYCPNAKLLINEYGTENDPPVRNTYKTIINLLKARGLIDGIGIQAHYFNIDNMNRAAVTTMLNDYATLALDVWVSELDIVGPGGDAGQLAKYQDVFPGFWEHASVKGITIWGYIVGQTWRDGTGLVTTGGQERPAMTWLKGYVSGTPGGDTQAPSVPAGLTSTATTSSSVTLAWTASTDNVGVTGYQVLRAPGASGGTFAQVGTPTSNSFVNTGLTANTTYRYQVRAVDAAGNASAVSNTVTVTTQTGGGGDTQPPSIPANLTAPSTTTSSISLAWTASTDNVQVTGYQILRAPGTSGGTFAQIATSTTNSYVNTGLTANTAFRYQVRAVDAAGNASAVSNTVSATTQSGGTGGGCTVAATVQTQWQSGYVIEPARVTNTGTATINSWTVTFTLPAGHAVTGSWNAVLTVSGQTVTARNASYNGTVGAGGNTAFGFQVSRPNGNTQLPSGYVCATP
ncbi:MAG TPA: endo-1,4-beta-xylanase [Steroidobacteraceae bacterium]